MVCLVISEGLLSRRTPQGCTAVIGVFQAYYVVYVDEVTGLVGIEAYGGIWLVALEVEAVTIVATRNYS